MKKISFSSHNQPRENGASTYAIWKNANNDLDMIGVLYKNRHGKWTASLNGYNFQAQSEKFEDMKTVVREFLA